MIILSSHDNAWLRRKLSLPDTVVGNKLSLLAKGRNIYIYTRQSLSIIALCNIDGDDDDDNSKNNKNNLPIIIITLNEGVRSWKAFFSAAL